MAIMFAGSFVLAGVGGCIAGADEAETDREATAGGESGRRDNTDADGRRGGQTHGDRQSRAGGRQSGGEQAGRQGGRQGGEQGGRQGGRQGGEQAGYQGGRQGGGGQRGAEQACGEQAGYQGGRQGGSAQSGGHSAMRQVSEQELATLVSIINRQEVKLSKIALEKAESPEVQRFAEAMIDEHSRAEQHGVRLSRGATASIEACPQCQQLQDDAVETSESLQEQEGAEFDVAFIWAQISLHRRAIEILDEPLVEQTKSVNLRSHLMQMRSDVEQHLRRAEQIFCTLLQARQQQSGQQKGAQQQGPQSAQQQGQQGAQFQGQQQRGQQQGQQSAQQQRGQQQDQQSAQQRGQQQGAQFQGQQQRGQQQGQQSAQQQHGQQRGGQSQGQQSAPQGPLR
ncbi:hypothetical protein BE15_41730 [Sorangium cellulosum]|uniref:DUF4142 domain-containing protein n=2 Tax=Sorangium cellulosum TaxID=56 RepID=A0A150Q7H2_SORCE|nr:hypothetical protein BE15_41730 [Sorangium cellulosum]